MGSTFPRRSSYEFVAERVAYTFYDPAQATPELVREVYEIVNDNYKALRVLKIAREAQRWFVAHWLHEINIPTALIWGLNDTITPVNVAYGFYRMLPRAKLYFMDALWARADDGAARGVPCPSDTIFAGGASIKPLPPTLAVVPLLRYRRVTLLADATVEEARRLFLRYLRLYHLPIVDAEGHYRWLLPKKALTRQKPSTPLLSLTLKEVPPLFPTATIYDALQLMHAYTTPEIPITDTQNHYLGLLTADSLIQWWSQLGAVQERGSVLILETDLSNYSLTHIAHIVESEHAQILSAYLLSHEEEPGKIYIVLKVNTPYLTSIISLLERENCRLVSAHGDPVLEKNTQDQIDFVRRLMDL